MSERCSEGERHSHIELRTFGHATLVVCEDGEPLIATDPWLLGSVYWRSWWLEQYPSRQDMDLIANARYVYVTHSHPDHFHPPTLRRLGDPKTLHPAFPHYPVPRYLHSIGIPAEILSPLRWYRLTENVSIMSILSFLDDSILVIDTPDAIVLDVNDANPSKQLLTALRQHLPVKDKVIVLKSYSPASSAVATYRNGVRAPIKDKQAYVHRAEGIAAALGATHYVPFASHAFFSRNDSRWANEHKVTYEDLQKYWSQRSIELCPPFCQFDLATGEYARRGSPTPRSLQQENLKKVEMRERAEAEFSLPADFPERLSGYLSSVPLLPLVFRHGIGFRLTTSGAEWFYSVRKRSVVESVPASADIVISLADKVLYEALVNGILTDLGITMLIRVDARVDVRRAYLAFSLMALRDYGYSRGLRSLVKCAFLYAPYLAPRLRRKEFIRSLQGPPTPMPQFT
jgi:hypothetical protein